MRRPVEMVPLLLTLLRIALAPVVVLLAEYWPSAAGFGFCLVVAFLSDVFDGIVARRLNVATPNLRRLDSAADTIFYLAAVFAVWHLHPPAITERLVPLCVLAVLELARYAMDLAKFGREASYHMWSSKLWGIALFVGFFCVLVFGSSGIPVSLAVYVGILADIEGLAISMVLLEWKSDVPTLAHALQLRRQGRIQPNRLLDTDTERVPVSWTLLANGKIRFVVACLGPGLGLFHVHLFERYFELGAPSPDALHTVVLNNHGVYRYITESQDRNLDLCLGAAVVMLLVFFAITLAKVRKG